MTKAWMGSGYYMTKKLSYEYIKEQFSNAGYELLSDEYKNARTPLSVVCRNNHRTDTITYDAFKAGKRCRFCSHNAPITHSYVKSAFAERGYTLLSNVYLKASTMLDYICPKGHHNSITWNNFQRGCGCPECCTNQKIDIFEIKTSFSERGATLLSKKYTNSRSKLEYICYSGHRHSISWDSWKAGHGCVHCYNTYRFGPGNPSWKGGISFEPYCEAWKDREYKDYIKTRDGYKCLNPYCDSRNPNDLVIHHIDYNKKNCKPANLVTVCRSCNAKANKDREWHSSWYKAIIYRRHVDGGLLSISR